jgi:hypothetical protein
MIIVGVCAGKPGPLKPTKSSSSPTMFYTRKHLESCSTSPSQDGCKGFNICNFDSFLQLLPSGRPPRSHTSVESSHFCHLERTSNWPFRVILPCYSPDHDWPDPHGP